MGNYPDLPPTPPDHDGLYGPLLFPVWLRDEPALPAEKHHPERASFAAWLGLLATLALVVLGLWAVDRASLREHQRRTEELRSLGFTVLTYKENEP